MAFQIVISALIFCMLLQCVVMAIQFNNDVLRDSKLAEERMSREAAQPITPQRRAEIDRSTRNSATFAKQFRLLQILALAYLFVMFLIGFVTPLVMFWHLVRREMILLRQGVPVRAIVTGKRRWFLNARLETCFTTDRGESINKKQLIRQAEASLFQTGGSAWMLYLPSHPSRARVYGLKSTLIEVAR